jgi:competence protein ComEA
LNRFAAFVAVAALALAGAAGLWFGRSRPASAPLPVTTSAVIEVRTLTVHVSGAVVRPGLVQIVAPARVADVIVAAGGALGDAELGSLNLAASVSDGQHIQIPSSTSESGDPGSGKVVINQANAKELELLPGVGPVLAQRIFDYREAHGPFEVVEDLLDIPGIGEAKLASLRDAVVVP